ncbi:hypothetical protein O3M35_004750 [Rhynocoris fuscipes]|uniref:Uncharacterized protein n=1 Tax=Rhynocoris fuscipes TaxID=488301 RepID=A0AAW1DI68_9HEMI
MLRGLFVFGVGIYTGMYIAQNYEVRKVEDPATLFNKMVAYIDEKTKEAGKK